MIGERVLITDINDDAMGSYGYIVDQDGCQFEIEITDPPQGTWWYLEDDFEVIE